MNAKAYLQQIQRISAELQIIEWEIKQMYNPIKAVSYGNVPGTADADATLHLVERISAKKESYEQRANELIEKREEILEVIHQIKDSKSATVIYARYCRLMPFRQIAREMNYTVGRIMQIHRQGLNEVEQIIQHYT